MTAPLTKVKAREVKLLKRFEGPKGPLTFLKFFKADTYEQIFELPEDDPWTCKMVDSHAEVKTTTFLEVVIVETKDSVRNAAVEAATDRPQQGATRLAVEGRVYQVLHDHTKKPLNHPRLWRLRAMLTTGGWPPPAPEP